MTSFALIAVLANNLRGASASCASVVDWDKLQAGVSADEQPAVSCNFDKIDSPIGLKVECEVEYVGDSQRKLNNVQNLTLPTSYYMGWEPFESRGVDFSQSGSCSTKNASLFDGSNFNNWWSYTETPSTSDEVACTTDACLAYPQTTKYWEVSMNASDCSKVYYSANFTWNELQTECKDFNAQPALLVTDGADNITLNGTFYVQLVSPYSAASNLDQNFVYTLVNQDIEFSLRKQVDVLSSEIGFTLFLSSIIAVYQEGDGEPWKMVIMTQSANYLTLNNSQFVSGPKTASDISELQTSCGTLQGRQFTCVQIFVITIPEDQVDCDTNGEASLEGDYLLNFDADCQVDNATDPTGYEYCQTFWTNNGGANDGKQIALTVTSDFVDTTCDPQVFLLTFQGNLTCYADASFNSELAGPVDIGDKLWCKVEVDFKDDDASSANYDLLNLTLTNVYGCSGDALSLTGSPTTPGGCLSETGVDSDGPRQIIYNEQGNDVYGSSVIPQTASHVVAFEFLAYNATRNTTYLHAVTQISLQSATQRRRLLQNAGVARRAGNFIGELQVSTEARETTTGGSQTTDSTGSTSTQGTTGNSGGASATTVSSFLVFVSALVVACLN